jgi:SAM-dependent methyltransferase
LAKTVKPYVHFHDVYDEISNLDKKKHLFVNLEKTIGSDNPAIIEYGCGTGNFLLAPLDRGWTCFGVDNSEEMLCGFHRKLRNYHDITIILRDIFTYSSKSDFFDLAVITSYTINYANSLQEISNILVNASDALKVGGVLHFDFLDRGFVMSRLNKVVKTKNWELAVSTRFIDESHYTATHQFRNYETGEIVVEVHTGIALSPVSVDGLIASLPYSFEALVGADGSANIHQRTLRRVA